MDGSGTLCQYSPHRTFAEAAMSQTIAEPVLDAAPPADAASSAAPVDTGDEVLAEVLVEEISIDGMCGVY
jgi:mycofactocin precursor